MGNNMKELVFYPDDTLRNVSQPVVEFGSALNHLIEDMTWVARSLCGNALGISAIQCREPIRVGLLDMDYQAKHPKKPMVICNPRIIDREAPVLGKEGCLSFPGKIINIPRPTLIRIDYQDVEGRKKFQFFHHLWARCVLHEIDHMDGILFIDHEKPEVKNG